MLNSVIVPESESESTAWAKETVAQMIRAVGFGGPVHVREEQCYNLFYAHQSELDYEYLTGKADYRQPARMRFMPIAKPYFDLLISTQESRRLDLQAYSVDQKSLKSKRKDLVDRIMQSVVDRTAMVQRQISLSRLQLDAVRQQFAGADQGDPRTQVFIQQAEIEVQEAERLAGRAEYVLADEMEEMERQGALSARTHLEVQVSQGLEYLSQKYGWKRMFDEGFRDLLVTDNEVFRIEDVWDGKDPRIRKVGFSDFYYLSSMDAVWTDEVPAVLERRWMTAAEILDEYGDRLSSDDVNRIKERQPATMSSLSVPPNLGYYSQMTGAADDCDPSGYAGGLMFASNLIEVCICEWQAIRKISFKRSPAGKDGSGEHVHLITDDDKPRKNEVIEHRYLNEWWGGVRIGHDIYTDVRKLPFQFRDVDDIGKAYGRYVGYAYNGLDRQPYSRVWASKDISILYNITYYQLERLIALAGLKGVIMDKAQIPKGMEPDEWYYHLSQGIGWIDSQKEQPNGRFGSQYNQFATFDMTLGQSIQQIAMVLDRLEYMMGSVLGIPRQRLGEMDQKQLVGASKQAIEQSARVTETLNLKHELLVQRVLTRVARTLPMAWSKGKRGQYVAGRDGQKVFDIAAGALEDSSFEVFIGDNAKREQAMDLAMNALNQAYVRGSLPASQLIQAYRIDNLNELEETLKRAEDIAFRRGQQSQQSVEQAEMEKARALAEIDALAKQQLTQADQLDAQTKQAALQLEQQRMHLDADTRMQEAKMKSDTTKYVSDQETAVEAAYLREQGRKTDIETILRRLEMRIDAAAKSASGISSGRSKERIKD
jgi:hypothetical protein